MTWKPYKLVYRAVSPIHIGWHTLGYIKLTRLYVPGRPLWGAITANLTRMSGIMDKGAYKRVGDFVRDNIFTSYLFPAPDGESPSIRPDFSKKGERAQVEFERRFIGSTGQTAIEPQNLTAEDETLHETEYMAPILQDGGGGRSVHFVGYIFIREGASLDGRPVDWDRGEIRLKEVLRELQVGGDRKYGWGRLVLRRESVPFSGAEGELFGCTVRMKEKVLELDVDAGSPIPAHLRVGDETDLRGDIEPLVGREWGVVKAEKKGLHGGFGQAISEAALCWMPGSIMNEKRTLELGAYGLLTGKGEGSN